MALIEWKDEYSTGIADVDYEHRTLIILINDLYICMSSIEDSHTVMDFLGEIYAHISTDFALEEKIMREQNYDQYDEHTADHEKLLYQLHDIMDACEERDFFSDDEFAETFERWFSKHFSTHDARLQRYLA